MKLVPRTRPADLLKPSLDSARVARIWAEIERRQTRERRPLQLGASAWGLVVAVGLFLVAFGWMRWRESSTTPPSLAGVVIDTGASGQTLFLPDGSSVDVGPSTRLRIAHAEVQRIRLELDRGRVACEVTHREGRQFVVATSGAEVEVKGTRFEVDVEPASAGLPIVQVRVSRGAVEVRDGARKQIARLESGQTWSAGALAPAAPPEGPPDLPASPGQAMPSAAPAESARSLFERADLARMQGRHREAAQDLERLVRRYPKDSRAALAAYQLGRVCMGSLREPDRSIYAFTFAIEHASVDDPFVEDAEAGRIEAAEELGHVLDCQKWQATFMVRYPASVHVARVRRLCAER
jgi:hypothetical protein